MLFRRTVLLIAFLVLIPSGAWTQSKIAGDWQGSFNVDGTKLHLVLHVHQDEHGQLSAEVEVVVQNKTILVKSVSFDGKNLKLDIERIKGSYVGVLSNNGKELNGFWNEGGEIKLRFTKLPDGFKLAQPAAIGGDWEGTVTLNGVPKDLHLHINTTSCTKIMGTFDGPELATVEMAGLYATDWFEMTFQNGSLKFAVKSLKATYLGTLNDGKNEFNGVWKQGSSFALKFRRATHASGTYNRPVGCLGPAS